MVILILLIIHPKILFLLFLFDFFLIKSIESNYFWLNVLRTFTRCKMGMDIGVLPWMYVPTGASSH